MTLRARIHEHEDETRRITVDSQGHRQFRLLAVHRAHVQQMVAAIASSKDNELPRKGRRTTHLSHGHVHDRAGKNGYPVEDGVIVPSGVFLVGDTDSLGTTNAVIDGPHIAEDGVMVVVSRDLVMSARLDLLESRLPEEWEEVPSSPLTAHAYPRC